MPFSIAVLFTPICRKYERNSFLNSICMERLEKKKYKQSAFFDLGVTQNYFEGW